MVQTHISQPCHGYNQKQNNIFRNFHNSILINIHRLSLILSWLRLLLRKLSVNIISFDLYMGTSLLHHFRLMLKMVIYFIINHFAIWGILECRIVLLIRLIIRLLCTFSLIYQHWPILTFTFLYKIQEIYKLMDSHTLALTLMSVQKHTSNYSNSKHQLRVCSNWNNFKQSKQTLIQPTQYFLKEQY